MKARELAEQSARDYAAKVAPQFPSDAGDREKYDTAFYAHLAGQAATLEATQELTKHLAEFCQTCHGRIQVRCAKGCTQYNEPSFP
jgi:hypothetical protein